MSPLLFLFAIEPLAMAVRQSSEMMMNKGVMIGKTEHRLSLFDIVLFNETGNLNWCTAIF